MSTVAKNDLTNVDKHTIYDKIQDLLDFAKVDLSNVNDSDILNKLKNVDGEGSGLDADLLRGLPADFSCDLSENGYTRLPNGLIIQWGYYSSDSSGTFIVTLPIAFPNECLFVLGYSGTALPDTEDTYSGSASKYSNSQIKVTVDDGYPTAWLAIGY